MIYPQELAAIADVLGTLSILHKRIIKNGVSFDDVTLHDSNGEPLGTIVMADNTFAFKPEGETE